jgi:predicted phage tail protein
LLLHGDVGSVQGGALMILTGVRKLMAAGVKKTSYKSTDRSPSVV